VIVNVRLSAFFPSPATRGTITMEGGAMYIDPQNTTKALRVTHNRIVFKRVDSSAVAIDHCSPDTSLARDAARRFSSAAGGASMVVARGAAAAGAAGAAAAGVATVAAVAAAKECGLGRQHRLRRQREDVN
jgi:hypothetical protein